MVAIDASGLSRGRLAARIGRPMLRPLNCFSYTCVFPPPFLNDVQSGGLQCPSCNHANRVLLHYNSGECQGEEAARVPRIARTSSHTMTTTATIVKTHRQTALDKGMLYTVSDVPSAPLGLALGFQHFMTMCVVPTHLLPRPAAFTVANDKHVASAFSGWARPLSFPSFSSQPWAARPLIRPMSWPRYSSCPA